MELAFAYISIASACIPISIGYRRTLSLDSKIIFCLVLISLTCDILAFILSKTIGSNIFILNLYTLLELLMLAWFFSKLIPFKIVIPILFLTLFYWFWLIAILNVNLFKTNFNAIHSLVQIGMAISGLYVLYNEQNDIFIENRSAFWFLIALLTYFSGSLFTYILSLEILSNTSLTWTFHNIANILKNILFAVGLWKARAIN